ncbi:MULTISPECIES: hypothetical protein [Mesorhizobium]|uniref:hypothetical protein n=1 Tax=Mesorhizobium TaxID=68287 RepID=UPI000FE4D0C3|nr:hypothetical protein [Mesorhizobium sp.]RWC96117.1 MAG: hypothetical protein EOS32_09675 [Mesorhizobium sp.]TIW71715.1 MAG: hypothetical protein E5V58_18170 [Mesorhizobium sp.]TIX16965.1 MAG: hypothetical protein E5V41_12170 [Mesorhizobium sp.]
MRGFTMYRLLLGAALAATATSAFAADAVAPIVMDQELAQPHVSGYVEAYLGGLYVTAAGEHADGTTAGGTGRVNFPIDSRWNVQTDAFVDSLWAEGTNIYGYGGAVHGYWRDPSAFALGAFASVTGYGGDGFDDDLYSFSVGPEGQVYMGNVTVYGQVYYGQLRASGSSEHIDTWGGRGVVRYFAQDNLRFDGELGYSTTSVGPFDTNTFTGALQATYRFSGTAFSVFGRYQFERASISAFDVTENIHKYVIGVRASFGSDTLLDEDRNGATMDTGRPNLILPSLL